MTVKEMKKARPEILILALIETKKKRLHPYGFLYEKLTEAEIFIREIWRNRDLEIERQGPTKNCPNCNATCLEDSNFCTQCRYQFKERGYDYK